MMLQNKMDADVAARVERVLRGTPTLGSSAPDSEFAPSPFAPVVVPKSAVSRRQNATDRVARGVPPALLWTLLFLVLGSAVVAVAYVLSKRHSEIASQRVFDRLYDDASKPVPPARADADPGTVEAPSGSATPTPTLVSTNSVTNDDAQQRELQLAVEGEYTPLPQ